MSRPIKFRAWHKTGELMMESVTLEEIAGNACDWGDRLLGKADLEIMQFTGLFDKLGKEIFEGDILNVRWSIKVEAPNSEWKSEEHKAVIEWRRSGWIIGWSYFSKRLDPDGNQEICWYDDYHRSNNPGAFHKLTDFEVIGNRHEHPELLK